MDIIDYELKRYQAMMKDLEAKKEALEEDSSEKSDTKTKDHSKSVDELDVLMDEEKPKDVCAIIQIKHESK